MQGIRVAVFTTFNVIRKFYDFTPNVAFQQVNYFFLFGKFRFQISVRLPSILYSS